jgi:hypothetical protein
MLRIDPQIAAYASPLWIAAGSAVLLVMILCALALGRTRKGASAAIGRFLLVVIGAASAGTLTWALFDGTEQSTARRALELRAEALSARALMPGSPLACLDTVAGDMVQAACERALFATPANVASAISYVAAQFALFSDMADYARHGGTGIDATLVPLRRALEADPFGFVAHVLVRQDGCNSENCPPLALLHDPKQVRTNMIAQTLGHYVDEYRESWAKLPGEPLAEATEPQPSSTAEADPTGQRKVMVHIDFPSAASIPPISIMNPEPKAPASAEAGRKIAGKPAAHPGVFDGAATPPAQTDPVWTPAPAQTAQ